MTPSRNVVAAVTDEAVEAALRAWFNMPIPYNYGMGWAEKMEGALAAAYPSMVAEVERLRQFAKEVVVAIEEDQSLAGRDAYWFLDQAKSLTEAKTP